jgi:hypothetical protein
VVVARAAARRGAANPRVSAVERSGSDYHPRGPSSISATIKRK